MEAFRLCSAEAGIRCARKPTRLREGIRYPNASPGLGFSQRTSDFATISSACIRSQIVAVYGGVLTSAGRMLNNHIAANQLISAWLGEERGNRQHHCCLT